MRLITMFVLLCCAWPAAAVEVAKAWLQAPLALVDINLIDDQGVLTYFHLTAQGDATVRVAATEKRGRLPDMKDPAVAAFITWIYGLQDAGATGAKNCARVQRRTGDKRERLAITFATPEALKEFRTHLDPLIAGIR